MTVDLYVETKESKPMETEIMLSVVDVGVLNLIGYKTPNWFNTFYGQRPLSVASADTRIHLIGQRNYGEKGEMEELFIACIELANELKLPITVHNREADKTVLEILRTHRADRRGIIHCFSGDMESARQFLDLGYAISFAGNVTYKSNEALREAASYVPDSSILLETDSPYLSPVPVRGRVNTPLNISYTYEFAAQLRGTSAQELNEKVKQNYFSIL